MIAKTIIGATPRALVAKMASAGFGVYPSGKKKFKFTVVGNELKDIPGGSAKIHNEPVLVTSSSSGSSSGTAFSEANKQYKAIE